MMMMMMMNSRLMRWSLRLSEFDFVAEHKAGSKIGHVDALSRHVTAVMDEGILNKERILREKGKALSVTSRNLEPIPAEAIFFGRRWCYV